MPYLSGYEACPPPPFLAAPLPPPLPPPKPSPPPPALKVVREWEGVGVWPVATAPPWLGGFLVDDAFSPLPTNSAARATKEVLDKLVDGDSVPIDLLSQFEAVV